MQGTTLFRLRQLNLALEQTSRPCLAELGLTSAQAVVLLWFLRRGGSGACASELHRQLGVSKAALSATLKNLRRSGYLDTVRDPGRRPQKADGAHRQGQGRAAKDRAGAGPAAPPPVRRHPAGAAGGL